MRQSSGKSSAKRPWEIVPNIGGIDSENDSARRLLEKTHPPREFSFYNKQTHFSTFRDFTSTWLLLLALPARL
jgi:hypothetical protein